MLTMINATMGIRVIGITLFALSVTSLVYNMVSPRGSWAGVFSLAIGCAYCLFEMFDLNDQLKKREEREEMLENDVRLLKAAMMKLAERKHEMELRVWKLESSQDIGPNHASAAASHHHSSSRIGASDSDEYESRIASCRKRNGRNLNRKIRGMAHGGSFSSL